MADKAEEAVAPTVSVEDRVADTFMRSLGWDESQEQEQPETAAPEGEAEEKAETPEPEQAEEAKAEEGSEFVEVEFSGVKYQVPPELKDALMATQDYTKKTTELSQVRKAVELQRQELELAHEQRAFEQSLAAEIDRLKMIDAYLAHEKASTNWDSLTAEQAFKAKLNLDRLADERAELAGKLQSKYGEFKSKQDAERTKLKESANEVLSKNIPGWSEEKRAELERFVIGLGVPEHAAKNMSAVEAIIVNDAMLYRKIKSEAATTVKKAATPTITPSARREMPKGVQEKLNYRKAIKKAATPREREKLAEERIASIFGG